MEGWRLRGFGFADAGADDGSESTGGRDFESSGVPARAVGVLSRDARLAAWCKNFRCADSKRHGFAGAFRRAFAWRRGGAGWSSFDAGGG